MDPLRRPAAGVASALAIGLLLYWAALAAWAPGVLLAPMGGHDGLVCHASASSAPDAAEQASLPSSCGLSLTPLFAATLVLLGAIGVLAARAALRPGSRAASIAAALAGLAFVLVGVEAWIGRGSPSATLSALRTQTHLGALAIVALLLAMSARGGFMRSRSLPDA